MSSKQESNASELHESFKGLRILLAEDTEVNRMLIARMLNKREIVVDFASNGIEALEKVTNTYYNLIFMDLQMPEMDGIEATHNIRSINNLNQETPIVALSATASEDLQMMEWGINDYLCKPFKAEQLYEIITKHAIFPKSYKKRLVDVEKMETFAIGDKEVARKLQALYIELLQKAAQELPLLVASKNAVQIHALAHKVRPSAVVLAVEQINVAFDDLIKAIETQKNEKVIFVLEEHILKLLHRVLSELNLLLQQQI